MSKVSIIIPIYNVEPWLRKSVDSAIKQTYKNLEIILVDDGSTDNSGKICDEYKNIDTRIIVIHKENGGLVSARKAGLSISTGEYIYFLDSDDWIDFNLVADNVYQLNNSSADYTVFGFIEERETPVYISSCSSNKLVNVSDNLDLIFESIILSNNTDIRMIRSMWCKMFRRNIIIPAYNQLPLRCSHGEDYITTVETLFNVKELLFIDKCYYHYRIRDNSYATTRNLQTMSNIAFMHSQLATVFENHNYYDKVKEKLNFELMREIRYRCSDMIIGDEYKKILGSLVKKDNINSFIIHNYKVWNSYSHYGDNNENEVLILPLGEHYHYIVYLSYYANIFAKKYNAKIVTGDMWQHYTIQDDESLQEVYKSFNTKKILDNILTEKQGIEYNSLLKFVAENINSKEDIINLKIKGYSIGRLVYSFYYRVISPRGFFDLNIEALDSILKKAISFVVYWDDYFKEHHVKTVLLGDALYLSGIVREIALSYNIPVYSTDRIQPLRCFHDYYDCGEYGINIKDEFKKLSHKDQVYGIQWAKEQLDNRLKGDVSDIYYMRGNSAYGHYLEEKVLENNGKINVVICSHMLTDDPYPYGPYMFNDYYEWMCYLGEISNYTDYNWYLKIDPSANTAQTEIYKEIIYKYKKIKLLPQKVSAVQLKEEGLDFALTLWGTIGHEYAALGIKVINAGNNPHINFNFNYHAKSKEDYTNILMNLQNVNWDIDINEVYQFYCMHYLYKKPLAMSSNDNDIVFKKEQYFSKFAQTVYVGDFNSITIHQGSGDYRLFLDEWSWEQHIEIIEKLSENIDRADKAYCHFMKLKY